MENKMVVGRVYSTQSVENPLYINTGKHRYMTETEREQHLHAEQRLKDINTMLDRCIEDVQQQTAVLRSSRQRLEATFMWHPFPKTVPTTYGNYLVTHQCGKTREGKWNYRVSTLNWNGKNWQTWNADGIPTQMTEDVTAWMSLPMPYEWGRKE